MMQYFKANIVCFKKSKRKLGHYYPVFEYEDQYGVSKRYIRQVSMEKTPFVMDKTYVICKKGFQTFEKGEKIIPKSLIIFTLRICFLIIAFVNRKVALWTMAINWLCNLLGLAIKIGRQRNVLLLKDRAIGVDGLIVGYECKMKGLTSLDTEKVYYPLIQYTYNDQQYIHIGSVWCKKHQRMEGSVCKIYISTKHRMILDEFEINAPLINISQLSADSVKATSSRIIKRTKKMAQQAVQKKCVEKTSSTIVNPLKTVPYKRVAGWY
jgi:hypothetical protein